MSDNLDWEKAEQHLLETIQIYESLSNSPGVNTTIALYHVLRPLQERFEMRERTQELYDEMMSVE